MGLAAEAIFFEMALELPRRPLKIGFWQVATLAVLQTASGLQGEEPLVDGRMYGKGNRQNRSVTSGQGLALVLVCCAAEAVVWVEGWGGESRTTQLPTTGAVAKAGGCNKQELERTKGIRLFN